MPDILDQISDDLVDSMPEVSQHAIDEHDAQERKFSANTETDQSAPSPTFGSAPTDKNGKAYNPETHEISALTGKAIKKRRGGAVKKSVVSPGSTPTANKPSTQNGEEAKARATGQFAAATTVALCCGIFGDEFKPKQNESEDEFAYLSNAYGDYFLATGKTDLPPNMALIVALGMYIVPRFTMPKTQTKLGAFKDWAASKYLAWRGKKTMKNAEKQAARENKMEA